MLRLANSYKARLKYNISISIVEVSGVTQELITRIRDVRSSVDDARYREPYLFGLARKHGFELLGHGESKVALGTHSQPKHAILVYYYPLDPNVANLQRRAIDYFQYLLPDKFPAVYY